jgi:hypothetical protein
MLAFILIALVASILGTAYALAAKIWFSFMWGFIAAVIVSYILAYGTCLWLLPRVLVTAQLKTGHIGIRLTGIILTSVTVVGCFFGGITYTFESESGRFLLPTSHQDWLYSQCIFNGGTTIYLGCEDRDGNNVRLR